jgi:hypothetical protein
MSLSALNASLASAPPPAELPRDLGDKSGGGSKFTEIVNALAGEDLQPSARAAATTAAASAQDRVSPSENTSKSYESPSIGAGLAGLIYGAVRSSSSGGAPSRASGGRGAGVSSDQSADDSTAAASTSARATQNEADANSALAGLLYAALASPAATTLGQFVARSAGGESAAQQGASGSNADAANSVPASDGSAAVAPAAEKGAGAAFARAGVLDRPLTIRTAANGDASLSVSTVQSRTYLGADSAARNGVRNSIWRLQGRSAATATAPVRSATAETPAAAAAPTPAEAPSAKRSTSGPAATATTPVRSATAETPAAAAAPTPTEAPSAKRSTSGPAATATTPVRSATAETPAAAAAPTPTEAPSAKRWTSGPAATATAPVRSATAETPAAAAAPTPTQNDTSPEKRSTSNHGGSQAASLPDQSTGAGPAAIVPNASLGAVNAGANSVTTGVGPIARDQLAERLATEASGLTQQTAPTDSAPATGLASAQAVKELQIDLNPAHLGAVSVKMRMAQGQLSVVMEVVKPSTLKAIEGERSAIADRLGLSAQSLEILIAKPTATNPTSAESDHARNQKPGSQENGQSDPNRPSQGDEQQPFRRENAADRWNRQAAAQPSPSGHGFGDLVV